MVAELVHTSRLWGRTAARIDPAWVEPLAHDLLVRSHSEPRWDARRGAAVASERATLYGLPTVAARTVPYARVDPRTPASCSCVTRSSRGTGRPVRPTASRLRIAGASPRCTRWRTASAGATC